MSSYAATSRGRKVKGATPSTAPIELADEDVERAFAPFEQGGDPLTGTPAGVAATVAGDKLECEIEGVGSLTVTIGQPLK